MSKTKQMKVFKKKSEKEKSWSIDLNTDEDGDVQLRAVDSYTGEHICVLIWFYSDGDVSTDASAKTMLIKQGYDPYQHRNDFIEDESHIATGALKINQKM